MKTPHTARKGSTPVDTTPARPAWKCPSFQPEFEGAELFAVVVGTPTAPELAYLRQTRPVDDALLARTGDVDPTEVLRFAGPCAERGCAHYEAASGDCTLVRRSVALLEEDASRIPPCAIRTSCKWWNQEGEPACRRCPGIVSFNAAPDEAFRHAARPELLPADDLRPGRIERSHA